MYPTEAGIVQSSIISPTLINFAFYGLEKHIAHNFKPRSMLRIQHKRATRLNMVKYADDFIVTGQRFFNNSSVLKPALTIF